MERGVFIRNIANRCISISILSMYFAMIIFSFIIKPKVTYVKTNTVYGGITLYLSELTNLNNYKANVEETEVEVVGEEEIETEEIVVLDEYEVDLLARAIYNECGILGYDAMYLCGCVILNRVESNIYPNSIHDVLYQKGQYQIVSNGHINRSANEQAYEIARELLTNGSTIPKEVLFQSQFIQGSYIYKVIGNTYFCGL